MFTAEFCYKLVVSQCGNVELQLKPLRSRIFFFFPTAFLLFMNDSINSVCRLQIGSFVSKSHLENS